MSPFLDKVDLEGYIKISREILEDLISDIIQYRNAHLKIHKDQDKQFKDLGKKIKKQEKRIKDLELRKK